jgi:uncharacterized protein (TIGR02217 family)
MPILAYPLVRSPIWKTRRQENISGKEVRIADWSYPRYKWELTFAGLRQGTNDQATYAEMSQLMGFFDTLKGGWDSFLYKDTDDYSVTNQAIAIGDGASTVFSMVRTFGGAICPVLAPDLVNSYSVYVDGALKTPVTDYNIYPWGTSNTNGPGALVFTSAPAYGKAITATFQYYFPCRFDDDQIDFSKFLSWVYELKKLSFTSIK